MVADTADPQMIAARKAALVGYGGVYGFMGRMLKKDVPEDERDIFARRVIHEMEDPNSKISIETSPSPSQL